MPVPCKREKWIEIMFSNEIRARFLEFFEKKGHTVVPSDLLVPKDDPTLLFTGAGMNQFKDQFMGKNVTFKRATSSQKCLRTADLDNVGRTPRHHTFFEMLGNFSFGDYFKKEAILWAWEFMTKEMNIPEEKLWVSVYQDDNEAYDIWAREVKIPTAKIVRLGPADNFWPADAPSKGPNGPCGPCSEIFYDWGAEYGCGKATCNPACDCGRFVEVWNLVFTQFDRKPDGRLEPLPNKNIDTGMGLERIASVKQQVMTNFDTDLFVPIIREIKKELGDAGKNVPVEKLNLIADHMRAAVFTICVGVSPSNEKRGYVVRKLIRRAYLKSGRRGEFLYKIVPKIAEVTKTAYPEIKDKSEHIAAIVKEEEKKFNDTLNSAMPVFEEMVLKSRNKLAGEEMFKLVDTYGLPVDVIAEEAVSRGIIIDAEGFERLMEGRKEQSRKGSDLACEFIFKPDQFKNAPKPKFSDELPLKAKLEFILKGEKETKSLMENECAEIITSPQSGGFYAECGGQVGDTGTITGENGRMEIVDTFETDGKKIFRVIVREGAFNLGETVSVEHDHDKKMRTAANHTATHLLQAALRNILGDQVRQSGSFVNDKRLRFDFTHMKKLSDREIAKVEDIVNEWIEESLPVSKETKSQAQAKEEGALSFFGDKYGDVVRVVTVADKSKELCGGTHVDNTSEIGVFKIVGESSVASGIRRIEALTGENAAKWLVSSLKELLARYGQISGKGSRQLDKAMEIRIDEIIKGKLKIDKSIMHEFDSEMKPVFDGIFEDFAEKEKKREKEKENERFGEVVAEIDKKVGSAEVIDGVNFIAYRLNDVDIEMLRRAVSYTEKKSASAVILFAGCGAGKVSLVCAVTQDLKEKKLNAKDIINSIAGFIDGKGGGSAFFAQAGGKNIDGIRSAFEEAKKIIGGKV
ncbi:MAG: alanine--tRNA ligase [Candidatus Omnitrophica bacterium]|nr:alanine--tRNA ligase [Candidatus Omnitrophota bacterium]